MGTNEKQLENLLRGSDSNKIEEFLQSNLNTPQACGTVFESCLRRVAQQGIQKNRAETVLCVLKIVKYLCEQNNQRGIHVLIAAGILETLGKIFLYVTEKAAGRQLNVSDLLTLLLDCITSVIELQSTKYTWLQSNCDLFLSFLCKSYTNVELKRKVVEAFIGILVSLDSTSMDQIRSSISCTPLIDDLVENILLNLNYFGDYDVQVGIVELLFRLYPTVKRKEKAQSWNHNDETARLFCCISYNNFESSARAYINKVNQTSQEKWVASYHCMSLVIGDLVLGEKDECWMDLCFRSRNLGIAFGPRFEYGWYAVMSDNVEDFKIEDEESSIKMVLTTKVSVRRMFENDSFSDTLRVISFTFRKTAYFTAAFLRSKVNQIFSKIAK
uniref:Synaptonemal complex protein 2 armadillo-repeat-like domain-containing protein n=3 Tax=Ciona intestinalis TaxID=7719 RepID=F6TRT4_CIOIN